MIKNNEQQRKIEILAPAGSYASFKAAIASGADAVYAGGPRFGARAFAKNFDVEEMLEAIDYAHFHGRKFYLTVNTLLKDNEITELYDYIKPFYEGGLDAVIVQDLGVMQLIRSHFPGLEIHASTQMTVTAADGASFIQEQGASRVVPARELSLDEIREMKAKTGMEIECFVHGALCYCYSGQCLLSSLIGGRSGNRGQCAQPCRLPYQTSEEKSHLLSMKDICTLDLIPDLIEAGIDSFKIEGRMKQPEYVAGVTSIYRKYVDLYLKNGRKNYHVSTQDKEQLMDLYNRGGFHSGYYKQHNGRDMLALKRPNHAGITAFKVLSQKGREVAVQALMDINKGDILEFPESKESYTFGRQVKKGDTTIILAPKGEHLSKGTLLNRTRNQILIDTLNQNYTERKISEKINGFLRLSVGKSATMMVWKDDTYVQVESEMPVQEASKRPLTKETVYDKISKTGNTEFEFESLEIELDDNVFLPIQQLNELRRNALDELKNAVCAAYHRSLPQSSVNSAQDSFHSVSAKELSLLSVLVQTKEQLKAIAEYPQIRRIYLESDIPDIFSEDFVHTEVYKKLQENGTEIFLAMPRIFRSYTKEIFAQYIQKIKLNFDGILIRNFETFYYLRENNIDKKIILDHNVYVFNQITKDFWKSQRIEHYTVPLELNRQEIANLGIDKAEFVAYGYAPVMISAQCITKTTTGCHKKSEPKLLTDRYQNKFTVQNHCRECYNVIYNSAPLYLLDQKEDIIGLNPEMIRLEFSTETALETKTVLEQYISIYHGNTMIADLPKHYTRGHFRRGIT